MKGSLKIIQLFGIPVLLHWSFLLFAIFGYYYVQKNELSGQEINWWLLLSIAVFICILLHEYGHALMAKKFGVKTKDIILLPIGGMARLNKLPEKPIHEFLVAMAGPLVNILIAVLLFPFFWFITKPQLNAHPLPSPENLDDDFFLFIPLIIFINILLAVFNLIPAFPMDGGRMLRALLSLKTNRAKATKVAVTLGIIIAIVLGFYGIVSSKWLYILISLFIVNTAMKEFRWVKTEGLLKAFSVKDIFNQTLDSVNLNEDIKKVAKIHHDTGQMAFFVTDEMDEIIGVLDLDNLVFEKNGIIGSVKDFYKNKIVGINITDDLKKANELMQTHNVSLLVVYEEGNLSGLLHENTMWQFLSDSSK